MLWRALVKLAISSMSKCTIFGDTPFVTALRLVVLLLPQVSEPAMHFRAVDKFFCLGVLKVKVHSFSLYMLTINYLGVV